MSATPDRIEQFKAELAELHISDPATNRDRVAARLGLILLVAGVVVPLIAYGMSNGSTNALAQRDAIVLALVGVSLAAAGGALYLKGALAGFLRFWLARDLYERRLQTDRLLAAAEAPERPAERTGA